MPSPSVECRRRLGTLVRGLVFGSLLAAAVAGLAGCQDIATPVPQPLPANIEIVAQPSYGATVDVANARSFSLQFSRSMDPTSLRAVRRVSFLLPISVEQLEGRWSDDDKRLVFDLTQFPVQRGATYAVIFMGLRTADGELYNMGPYRVLFRTRGVPDLLPMQPHERVATMDFCRREDPSASACTATVTRSSWSSGVDSLTLETRTDAPDVAVRRDLFRRAGGRISWLGFDLEPVGTAPGRQVRWPDPPALLTVPTQTGRSLAAADQTAADGTALSNWSATDTGKESPVYLFTAVGLPIQVAFDDSRVIVLDYTLVSGGVSEHRRERWWLYPGVGLVRREVHSEQSGDPTAHYELDSFMPSVATFAVEADAAANQLQGLRGSR